MPHREYSACARVHLHLIYRTLGSLKRSPPAANTGKCGVARLAGRSRRAVRVLPHCSPSPEARRI